VGIIRDGTLHPNPAADYQLMPGDRLAVMGNAEQFAALQELFLGPNLAG
jgi:K+/H+ antiporter YhaU regulatory subunit KhtT